MIQRKYSGYGIGEIRQFLPRSECRFLGIFYHNHHTQWHWVKHVTFRRLKGIKTQAMLIPLVEHLHGPYNILRMSVTSILDRTLIYGMPIAGYWNIKGADAERTTERLREVIFRRYLHLSKRCAIMAIRYITHIKSLRMQARQESYIMFMKQLFSDGIAARLLRFMLKKLSVAERQRQGLNDSSYLHLVSPGYDKWAGIIFDDIMVMMDTLKQHGGFSIITKNGAVYHNITEQNVLSELTTYYKEIVEWYINDINDKEMLAYSRYHTSSNLLLPLFGDETYGDHTTWLSKVNSCVRFLAQSLAGVSPFNRDLHRRQLTPSPHCRRCHAQDEDLLHLFTCCDEQYAVRRSRLRGKLINTIGIHAKHADGARDVIQLLYNIGYQDRKQALLDLGNYLFKKPTYADTKSKRTIQTSSCQQCHDGGDDDDHDTDNRNELLFNGWIRRKLIRFIFECWQCFKDVDN